MIRIEESIQLDLIYYFIPVFAVVIILVIVIMIIVAIICRKTGQKVSTVVLELESRQMAMNPVNTYTTSNNITGTIIEEVSVILLKVVLLLV